MASSDVSSFLEKANEIQKEIESLSHRLSELMDNFSKRPQIQTQQEEPQMIESLPEEYVEAAQLNLFERVALTIYNSDEESPDETPELPPVEDPPAEIEEPKEDEKIPLPVEEEDDEEDEEEEQHEVDGVKVGLKQLPPFHLKGAKWRKEHCHLEVHKFRILHNNEKVGWCRLVVATSSMDLVEVEDGDEEIIIRKHPRLHWRHSFPLTN